MTPDIRPLVAGNWKMNGTRENLAELKAISEGLGPDLADQIDALICPPATLLYVATAVAETTPLSIGAQDCHDKKSGAYTGDISAEMILDAGATCVIVGHSERRADHNETSADVHEKARAAHRAGLLAIICVGESREQREG
ncbi:MAG: triosephosphate isomerase, partial [Nitratireductor sp.]|nr:triosephosphate isomerase [Nitratireductor sp.]